MTGMVSEMVPKMVEVMVNVVVEMMESINGHYGKLGFLSVWSMARIHRCVVIKEILHGEISFHKLFYLYYYVYYSEVVTCNHEFGKAIFEIEGA